MLNNLEILQLFSNDAAAPGQRAILYASTLAKKLGASIFGYSTPEVGDGFGFYDIDLNLIETTPIANWINATPNGKRRIVLQCASHSDATPKTSLPNGMVKIHLADWETEETLFAHSGIAELYGEPEREPLTPAGHFAAHTIGYATFAATLSLWIKQERFESADSCVIEGRDILTWVNWKSVVHAQFNRNNKRQGEQAEWPLLKCKDGFAAFLFNDRDWDAIVDLVGDPILGEDKFRSFKGRQENRDEYMRIIRAWCNTQTKQQIAESFVSKAIPGAPACTVNDLFSDPLLSHRNAIEEMADGRRVPKPAIRVVRESGGTAPADAISSSNTLPLAGMRILDFGIITAGAGVSALLADMGAEVLKIESHNRADPFRQWPGAAANAENNESPVFKCNNRNKYGVAIDLKTEDGKRKFFELAKTADIIIENYRRGVLDRLGLTFDALREVNSNILLASISAQGIDGPGANHTTFGSTLEANSGFANLIRYGDSAPYISGRNLNYPDQIVCIYGAAMVAAHATECRKKGIARQIDISQRDCAIHQLGDVMAYVSGGGNESDIETIRTAFPRAPLSAMFKCADDRYVALTAMNEEVASRIDDLSSIGRDDVSNWAAARRSDEAIALFISAGGGGALSRLGTEMLADNSLQSNEIFSHGPNGALVKGFPFQFTQSPMRIWGNSPLVGEHTEQFVTSTNSSPRKANA